MNGFSLWIFFILSFFAFACLHFAYYHIIFCNIKIDWYRFRNSSFQTTKCNIFYWPFSADQLLWIVIFLREFTCEFDELQISFTRGFWSKHLLYCCFFIIIFHHFHSYNSLILTLCLHFYKNMLNFISILLYFIYLVKHFK